ncbi:MAG: hypothetical protein AAGJ81_11575 [Verrucomicrobiota bacterium]
MKTLHSLPRIIITSVALSVGALSLPSAALSAEVNPSEKVGLMASALRLKDQGEYAQAFERVMILREVSPEDPSVNRLYEELVDLMDAEGIPFAVIDTDMEDSMEESPGTDSVGDDVLVNVPEPEGMNSAATIEDAKDLAAAGEYLQAIALLNNVQAESDDPGAQAEAGDLIAAYIIEQEAGTLETAMENSEDDMERAEDLASEGRYAAAYSLLDAAITRLPLNTGTEDLIEKLEDTRREILLDQAEELADKGEGNEALEAFQRYQRDPSSRKSLQNKAKEVEVMVQNPYAYNIRDLSPGFVAEFQRVQDLLVRGRAQFVNGDIDGARQTFALVETISPENVEAKAFLYEIAKRANEEGYLDRTKTREEMLNQVSRGWQQPRVYIEDVEPGPGPGEGNLVLEKLEAIIIPRVTFRDTSLPRAVQSLSEMSEEFDRSASADGTRGVNMVVTGTGGTDSLVNFSVRNLSLLRILDIVADQTGFQWDVVDQVVVFNPSEAAGGNNRLQRAIIPISKGTLDLILDIQSAAGGGGGGGIADDPFAAPTGPTGPATDDRQDALVNFFEASGINFRDIQGASIVNRGSRLLVNQTSRNIEEIRQTLRELDITDQVEIEAKFMEVLQGNLDELAFQWDIANQGQAQINRTQATTTSSTFGDNRDFTSTTTNDFNETTVGPPATSSFTNLFGTNSSSTVGNNSSSTSTTTSTVSPVFDSFGNPATTPSRGFENNATSLATIFGTNSQTAIGTITTGGVPENFNVSPGDPPNALDLGADIISNFFTSGVIGNFDINLLVRAVSRLEGSDLLSAPRVTVMSGKSANIVVAQEFIYPTSYGEPTVTADSGGGSSITGGGGGAVAVASGVPEDFETRNLGVELTVTPTVEPNDKINLALQPRVTEFEGYVSYGGPNIALTSFSSVQSPSGYFQPIFSTRTVETEVTVFDGATVVLGGLTREEVKEYNEKIPVLGDIPLIGRIFRSEGETNQKLNLIIFVTANLISPGGSPAAQSFAGTESNSLFQNPTLISPGGILSRDKSTATED